ncbi:MAG: SIR2 family protein [Pirellulales bacterium]
MDELTAIVQRSLTPPSQSILDGVIAHFSSAPRCTIEDYMSELVDQIAIAERRRKRAAAVPGVTIAGVPYSSEQLAVTLDDVKREIAKAIATPGRSTSIENHRQFIRTIHGALRHGKSSAPRFAVDYFTLNYDTLVEDALSLERISTVDGFHGGATGWWDVAQYNDGDALARVYKLHGSIDWCLCDGDVLPRRIRDGLSVSSRQDHLLIWPAATKYRETQRDPYAQLVSLMRQRLRPTLNAEVVLCVCGYAFADEHINFEIDRALRESGERLTVAIFTSDDEPQGQLKVWLDDDAVADRIRIHSNRGFFHATNRIVSDVDLPWWRFEVLTQLLAGQR